MANLKAIRTRITSFKSTRQITSAMKMVSAAKLRKAQDKIVRLRPYANKLHELLVDLSLSLSDSEIENIYGRVSPPEKVLIVVITSNRGLCGAFNTNVINETRRVISEKYLEQLRKGTLQLLTIGRKGFDYFRKQKVHMLPEQNNLFNNLNFSCVFIERYSTEMCFCFVQELYRYVIFYTLRNCHTYIVFQFHHTRCREIIISFYVSFYIFHMRVIQKLYKIQKHLRFSMSIWQNRYFIFFSINCNNILFFNV